MLILPIWILLSLLVAYSGRNRKFGFWGFLFCSLVFTPIVGLLLVLASSRRDADEPSA